MTAKLVPGGGFAMNEIVGPRRAALHAWLGESQSCLRLGFHSVQQFLVAGEPEPQGPGQAGRVLVGQLVRRQGSSTLTVLTNCFDWADRAQIMPARPLSPSTVTAPSRTGSRRRRTPGLS
jgi:hypothetical protein